MPSPTKKPFVYYECTKQRELTHPKDGIYDPVRISTTCPLFSEERHNAFEPRIWTRHALKPNADPRSPGKIYSLIAPAQAETETLIIEPSAKRSSIPSSRSLRCGIFSLKRKTGNQTNTRLPDGSKPIGHPNPYPSCPPLINTARCSQLFTKFRHTLGL